MTEIIDNTSSQPAQMQVGSGEVTPQRTSPEDTQEFDIDAALEEAMRKHRRLSSEYIGYKYSVCYPTSMEATITPALLPSEMQEKYSDEKLRLGKMDTMPTWIKKIGASIRSQIVSSLKKFSSNTDTRFGYMVRRSKFNEVEANLLACRGITEKDHETYADTPEIIAEAQLIIQNKLDRRSEWEIANQAPVTYNDYVSYIYERYDILRAEIIAQYRRLFSEDLVEIIISYIPTRESLRNPRRIRCEWYRSAIGVPECYMERQASVGQLIEAKQFDTDMKRQSEAIMRQDIESWKTLTEDTASDIQVGVRRMIAEKVSRMKEKLDKAPMSETEIEERREGGAKRVVDPARITPNSVQQLTATIDELTEELGEFDSSDQFYQAITEFRRSLNMDDVDLQDTDNRQRLSSDIDRIIELSLDDSSINPETGDFFANII
mgnify:CR=1 FL=1